MDDKRRDEAGDSRRLTLVNGEPPARAAARDDDVGGDDPRRWRMLWSCLAAGFMTMLDISIVNIALPSIQQAIGATGSQLQWVLTGYAVVFGLVLVPAGRLGDSFGRKRLFLLGLVLFTLGSLGCGVSQSPTMLVVTRILQGLGAGTLSPQMTAIINSEFRGAERGRAYGLFGSIVGVSTAAGPLLGGVIIDFVPLTGSWRYIFLVNIPVAAVAFVLGLRLIPARGGAGRQRTDWVGTVLLGTTVVLVLLAVQERDVLGWPLVVAAGVVAAFLAAVFVRWERRYADRGGLPLVRPGLMRVPDFGVGLLLSTLYFAGFTSIFMVLTLYLQQGLQYGPLAAGLAQTPFALASAVGAPLAGRATARKGPAIVLQGLAMMITGLLLVVAVVQLVAPAVGRGWTGLLLVVPLLVAGFGSAAVISPNVNLTLAHIDAGDAGSASGVFQMFQRLGGGIGLAVVSSVFFVYVGRHDYTTAITAALGCTVVLALAALAAGALDLRRRPPASG